MRENICRVRSIWFGNIRIYDHRMNWNVLPGKMRCQRRRCSLLRKGLWRRLCQVPQKCRRGAKIGAVRGEKFVHCSEWFKEIWSLTISPFEWLYLVRYHISRVRSIWFSSIGIYDHINVCMYNTGREAEAGWGRRARWWARRWWRGCSMLLLQPSPLLTTFGQDVSLTRTAISTLSTSKNDSGNWFHQLIWKLFRKLEIAEGLPRGSLVTLEDSILRHVSILGNTDL